MSGRHRALSAEMGIAVWSSGSGAVLWGIVAIVAALRSGSWPSPAAATCNLLVVVLASKTGLAAFGTLLLTEALATTVPQASRARKQVRGVAMSTYLMMCAGASCWVIYGAGAGDWPLSASSLLKAIVCAYIVVLVRIATAGARPGKRTTARCQRRAGAPDSGDRVIGHPDVVARFLQVKGRVGEHRVGHVVAC